MIGNICLIFLIIIAVSFGITFFVSDKSESEIDRILRIHREELKRKK